MQSLVFALPLPNDERRLEVCSSRAVCFPLRTHQPLRLRNLPDPAGSPRGRGGHGTHVGGGAGERDTVTAVRETCRVLGVIELLVHSSRHSCFYPTYTFTYLHARPFVLSREESRSAVSRNLVSPLRAPSPHAFERTILPRARSYASAGRPALPRPTAQSIQTARSASRFCTRQGTIPRCTSRRPSAGAPCRAWRRSF